MKASKDKLTRKIMQLGVRKVPSENFNDRVIHQLEQKRKEKVLKPAGSQSLLVVLASVLLILSGIVVYLQGASVESLSFIQDPAGVMQTLFVVLSVIFVYAIYTLLAEFLESRSGWNGSHHTL
ncbi:MAG: hypothetical protein KGY70_18565 [Bacteroidales bacterium]|nr:hypothetical protein [Bacteroidales bacterium]